MHSAASRKNFCPSPRSPLLRLSASSLTSGGIFSPTSPPPTSNHAFTMLTRIPSAPYSALAKSWRMRGTASRIWQLRYVLACFSRTSLAPVWTCVPKAQLPLSCFPPQGGIMGIQVKWDCNLDRAASLCLPRYSFRRLDTRDLEHNVSPGYNFRCVRLGPSTHGSGG